MQRSDALNTSGDTEHPVKKMLIICDQAITENLPFFTASNASYLKFLIENYCNQENKYLYQAICQEIKKILDAELAFLELIIKYSEKIYQFFPKDAANINCRVEERDEGKFNASLASLDNLSLDKKNNLYSHLYCFKEKIEELHQNKKESQIRLYMYFLNPEALTDKFEDGYFILIKNLFFNGEENRKGVYVLDAQRDRFYEIKKKYIRKVVNIIDQYYKSILKEQECADWEKRYSEIFPTDVEWWVIKKNIVSYRDEYSKKSTVEKYQISKDQYQNLTNVVNNRDYDQALEQYGKAVENSIQQFYQLIEKKWKDKVKELDELMSYLVDVLAKGYIYFWNIKVNGVRIYEDISDLSKHLSSNSSLIKEARSFNKPFTMAPIYADDSYQTHPEFYVESFKKINNVIDKLMPLKKEKEKWIQSIESMKKSCQMLIEKLLSPLPSSEEGERILYLGIWLDSTFDQGMQADYLTLNSAIKNYESYHSKLKIIVGSREDSSWLVSKNVEQWVENLQSIGSKSEVVKIKEKASQEYQSRLQSTTSSSFYSSSSSSLRSSSDADITDTIKKLGKQLYELQSYYHSFHIEIGDGNLLGYENNIGHFTHYFCNWTLNNARDDDYLNHITRDDHGYRLLELVKLLTRFKDEYEQVREKIKLFTECLNKLNIQSASAELEKLKNKINLSVGKLDRKDFVDYRAKTKFTMVDLVLEEMNQRLIYAQKALKMVEENKVAIEEAIISIQNQEQKKKEKQDNEMIKEKASQEYQSRLQSTTSSSFYSSSSSSSSSLSEGEESDEQKSISSNVYMDCYISDISSSFTSFEDEESNKQKCIYLNDYSTTTSSSSSSLSSSSDADITDPIKILGKQLDKLQSHYHSFHIEIDDGNLLGYENNIGHFTHYFCNWTLNNARDDDYLNHITRDDHGYRLLELVKLLTRFKDEYEQVREKIKLFTECLNKLNIQSASAELEKLKNKINLSVGKLDREDFVDYRAKTQFTMVGLVLEEMNQRLIYAQKALKMVEENKVAIEEAIISIQNQEQKKKEKQDNEMITAEDREKFLEELKKINEEIGRSELKEAYQSLPKLNSINDNAHECIKIRFKKLKEEIEAANPDKSDVYYHGSELREKIEKLSEQIKRANLLFQEIEKTETEAEQLRSDVSRLKQALLLDEDFSKDSKSKEKNATYVYIEDYHAYLKKNVSELKKEKSNLDESYRRKIAADNKEKEDKLIIIIRINNAYATLPSIVKNEPSMHILSLKRLFQLGARQEAIRLKLEESKLEKHDKSWLNSQRQEIAVLEEDIKEGNERVTTAEKLIAEVNALRMKVNENPDTRDECDLTCDGLDQLINVLQTEKQTLTTQVEEQEKLGKAAAEKARLHLLQEVKNQYQTITQPIAITPGMYSCISNQLSSLTFKLNTNKEKSFDVFTEEQLAAEILSIHQLDQEIRDTNNDIHIAQTLHERVQSLSSKLGIAEDAQFIHDSIQDLIEAYSDQIQKLEKIQQERIKQLELLTDLAKHAEEEKVDASIKWMNNVKKHADYALISEDKKVALQQAQAEVEAAKKALEAAKLIEEKATEALDESKWEETERKLSLDLILSEEKEKKLEIEKQEEEIKRLTALEESIKLAALEKEAKRAVLLQRLALAQEAEAKAKAALTGAVLIEEKMKAEAKEEERLKEAAEKALREAREKEARLQAVLDEAVKVAGEKKEGVDIKVKEQNGLLLEIADHEKTIKEYQEAIASIEAATLASLHKELSDAQELEAKAKTALKGAVAAETKAKAALEEATAEKTKAANVMKEITEEGKKEERLSAILKAAREEERKAEEVLAKLKEKEAEQLAKVKEAIEAAEKISQRQKRQEKRLAKEAKRQAKLSELQTKMASLSPQLMTITDNMHLASKARLKHLNQKIQTMDQLELNALPLRAVKTMLAEVTALAAEIKEANETIDAVEKLKVDLIKLRQATSRSHEGYVEIGDLAQLKKALEAEKAKIEEEEKARETKVAILAGKRAALTSPMAATAVIAPACQAYLGELAERYRQEQEKGKSDAYVSIEEVNAQIAAVDLLAEAITQAPEEIKAVQALLTEVKELEEAKLIPAQDAASIQNMKELKRALESVKQRGMLALNAEIEIVEKKREALKEELNKLAQDYACLNRKTDDASIAYVEMLKIHQAVCKETLETLEAIEIKQDSPLAENAGKITKLREEMERINYVLERSEAKREEYLEGMVQTYNEKIANLSEDKTYQALNKQIEELEKEYQTLSEEGLKDKETKAYLSYLKAECDRRRNAAEGMLDDHKYINLNSGVLTIGKVLEREQGIEDQKAVLVHLFSERQAIDARRKHYEEAKERIGLLEALTRYRKMMETFVWQRTEAPLESVSKLIHPCEEYAELDKTRLNKKRIKGGSGQGVIPLGKIKSKETSLLEATTTINEKAVPQSSLFSQRGGRQQVSADRKPVTTTMHRLDMEKATQAALTENKKPIKPREAKIEKKIRKDIADCQSRIKSFEEEMDVAVVLQIPLMFLKWTGITQERDKPLAERSIGYLKQKVGEAEEIIWKITEINAVDPLSIYVPPAIDDDKFVYEAPPSPVLSPSPLTLFSKKGKKQDLSIAEMPKQSVAKSKHANGIGRSQGIRALEERIRKLEVEIKMSKWESYTESQTHRREMKAAWDTLLEEMKAVLESIQALEEEGQNIILLPGQKENTYKVLLVSVFATVRQETYSTEDKHLSKYLVEIDDRYQQSLSSKYQHIQIS